MNITKRQEQDDFIFHFDQWHTPPCSDKVTELCKLQTETRLIVAESHEKYEAMMNQVDIIAETQVMMAYFDLLNIIYN